MLKKESNYDFRKKLLEVHKEDIRDFHQLKMPDETELSDGCTIVIPEDSNRVILTAAKDFQDYLFTSMGVASQLRKGSGVGIQNAVILTTMDEKESICETECKTMGFQIEVQDAIRICGFDDRGAAQGLYYLEDQMSIRKAPFIKKESIIRKPLFSPRMIHSGYGMDNYPDAHLSAIAHAGMDAILVFVKDIDTTPGGYMDFGELIYRAEKYGIDVYAYSYLISEKHPDDIDAKAYYHNLYGKLFERYPKLKGIVFVGESVEFPSKDTHTTGRKYDIKPPDHIPEGKPSPGWWPCEDYPQWLNLVKNTIRSVKQDADIVFWTYNWGWAPEEDRIRLIQAIPTDVSLLVTYEMFEKYKVDDITEQCTDYTLSFAGPGAYFISEAKAAHERGIRLYAMANTGGLTWDFGMIPYQPMPYQWMKRYEGLKQAKEQWGLCGLMESHHYGFYPSFVSELTKSAYFDPGKSMEECLREIMGKYAGNDTDAVLNALQYWSEAITYYTITNEDQYGPFRIGTAYPLCLNTALKPPDAAYAHFGSDIYYAMYQNCDDGRKSLFSVRVQKEIELLQNMARLMNEGILILEDIQNPSDYLLSILNLGKYIYHCVMTAIHTKRWYILRLKLFLETTKEELELLLDEMEALARAEIQNAKESIPLVEADSRLGWEPSMEYLGDAEHIRWKIKQVNYMIDSELSIYKKGLLY